MQMGAYRMFRKHSDWVECLVVVKITINGQTSEEIFTAGADGVVLRWLRDTEQNCDIYQCVVSRVEGGGGCCVFACKLPPLVQLCWVRAVLIAPCRPTAVFSVASFMLIPLHPNLRKTSSCMTRTSTASCTLSSWSA